MSDTPSVIDLENIRSTGIRSLEILCGCGCRWRAEVNVDQFPPPLHRARDEPVLSVRCVRLSALGGAGRNGANMRRDLLGYRVIITEHRGPIQI